MKSNNFFFAFVFFSKTSTKLPKKDPKPLPAEDLTPDPDAEDPPNMLEKLKMMLAARTGDPPKP